jgi:hypothetical protein
VEVKKRWRGEMCVRRLLVVGVVHGIVLVEIRRGSRWGELTRGAWACINGLLLSMSIIDEEGGEKRRRPNRYRAGVVLGRRSKVRLLGWIGLPGKEGGMARGRRTCRVKLR